MALKYWRESCKMAVGTLVWEASDAKRCPFTVDNACCGFIFGSRLWFWVNNDRGWQQCITTS